MFFKFESYIKNKVSLILIMFLINSCGQNLSLNSEKIIIKIGEEEQITIFSNENGTKKVKEPKEFNFNLENPDIIKVSESGFITANNIGKSKVYVSYKNFFLSLFGGSKVINVEVINNTSISSEKKIKSIEIKPTNINLKVGHNQQLQATVYYSDRKITNDVKWSSSDENIAFVNQSGLVTAINIGNAKIFASYILDENYKVFVPVAVSE